VREVERIAEHPKKRTCLVNIHSLTTLLFQFDGIGELYFRSDIRPIETGWVVSSPEATKSD